MQLPGCSGADFGPRSGPNARGVGGRHAGFHAELGEDIFQVMPYQMFSRHDTAERHQRGFRRLAEVGRHDELLKQIQFDRWLGHSTERI